MTSGGVENIPPVLMTLREQGIDPHEVIIPGKLMADYGPAASGEVFTIAIVGDAEAEGAKGHCEFRFQQVPVLNALGLSRARHTGRAALLESVGFPSSESTGFSRVLSGVVDKLYAITGADRNVAPIVQVRGSGKGATYRMSPNLRFDDIRGEADDRLMARVSTERVLLAGKERTVAKFPSKAVRERIFTNLLEEYGRRPMTAIAVARVLVGHTKSTGDDRNIKLLSYPQLTNESEELLFEAIENGLLAYTSPGDTESDIEAMERSVVAYNQLVFHCQYIAYAVARKFAHRMPLGDLYQEANLAVMRVVKQHEIVRSDEQEGDLQGHVRVAVDRHIKRVIAEESAIIRVPHSAAEALHALSDKSQEFIAIYHRQPTDAELTKLTGLGRDRIRELLLLDGMFFQPIDGPTNSQGSDDHNPIEAFFPRQSTLLFDRLINEAHTRVVLQELMHSNALTDNEKVTISVLYGVHFPSLAGIETHDFLYPYNPKFFPTPDVGAFNLREAGRILGVSSGAVFAAQKRALGKARGFLFHHFGMSSYEDF